MANKRNFLIGYGESLTEIIIPAGRPMEKNHPYTFIQSQKRLIPQINETVQQLTLLPDIVCPENKTVVSLILHPAYLAKSYYPKDFLRIFEFEALGSKSKVIIPEKWGKENHPQSISTTELFISGSKEQFANLQQSINKWNDTMPVAKDLIKIESISTINPSEKVKPFRSQDEDLLFEIILHTGSLENSNIIIEGFKEYLDTLDVPVDLNRRLYSDGLCFLPIRAKRTIAEEIAKYSFLRLVREMPRLRPIMRTDSNSTFSISLPNEAPIDPNLRVAIFDGGMPSATPLDKWTTKIDAPKLSRPLSSFTGHGLAVTSAFLFGNLQRGVTPPPPYAYVDHFRVLDYKDYNHPDVDLYHVLVRIKDILKSRNYSFINMSVAPELPIDDDPVDAWTATLDPIFASGTILATIASGNGGQGDRVSGNARIQTPADCVNALAVGAANSTGSNWTRAPYSSVGPGRSPGIVKPDVIAFGGSRREMFYFINPNNHNLATGAWGTSLSAPLAMRIALAIRAHYGNVLTPVALKALLIHAAEESNHDKADVGWGRLPINLDDILLTDDNTARIVFQGKLSPAEWVKFPIPVPQEQMKGMVQIKATICFYSMTDPKDSISYTRSGLEIVFRPHEDKRSDPTKMYADSLPFFQVKDLYGNNDNLKADAHKWETTISATKNLRGTTLKNPSFNIHYNARNSGAATDTALEIPYALIITVRSRQTSDLYNQIVTRYATKLGILQPVIKIPVQT